ncbi:hypothetical protein BOX15_Mlig030740g1 [Macrostomum lignano]|uniref:SAM domain-containing protein n=1 Tax=Macrostomum lignano TaxID=282301 RepID=A0A267EEJ4_9PLAT|nr:hypothetical protein BOX15_Mlig030740g1 [Macrostomum lignano]
MHANCEEYFKTADDPGSYEFRVDIKNRASLGATLHDRFNKSSSVPHCFVGWSAQDQALIQEALVSATASAHCQILKHPDVIPTLWLKPMDEVSLVASFRYDRRFQYRMVFNVFIFDKSASLRECAQCAEAHARGIYDGTNSKSGNRRLPTKIGSVYAQRGPESLSAHYNSALLLLTSAAQYVCLGDSSVLGLLTVSPPVHPDSSQADVSVPMTITCPSSHVDRGSKKGICVTVCLEAAPAGRGDWQFAGRFAFRVRAVASPYRDLIAEVCELLSQEQIGCPAGCSHMKKTQHQSSKLAGTKRPLPPEDDSVPPTPPPQPAPQPAPPPPPPPQQQQLLFGCETVILSYEENSNFIGLHFQSAFHAKYGALLLQGLLEGHRQAQQLLFGASGLTTPPVGSSQGSSSDSSGNPMLGNPMLSVPLATSSQQQQSQQSQQSQQQQQQQSLNRTDTLGMLLRLLSNSTNPSTGTANNSWSFNLSQSLQQQQPEHQAAPAPAVAASSAAHPTPPLLSSQPTIIVRHEPTEVSAAPDASASLPHQPSAAKPRLVTLATEAVGVDAPQKQQQSQQLSLYPTNASDLLHFIGLNQYANRFARIGINRTEQLARMTTAELVANSPDGPRMRLEHAQLLRKTLDGFESGGGGGGSGGLFQLERLTPSTGDSQSSSYRPGGKGLRRSPRQNATSSTSSTVSKTATTTAANR